MVRKQKTRKRRDHYLPQGYLRGFIDPARTQEDRPLWHFDIRTKQWDERSPSEVGHGQGFYDYAGEKVSMEPADITFASLERNYPIVRERLIANTFATWTEDR